MSFAVLVTASGISEAQRALLAVVQVFGMRAPNRIDKNNVLPVVVLEREMIPADCAKDPGLFFGMNALVDLSDPRDLNNNYVPGNRLNAYRVNSETPHGVQLSGFPKFITYDRLCRSELTR